MKASHLILSLIVLSSYGCAHFSTANRAQTNSTNEEIFESVDSNENGQMKIENTYVYGEPHGKHIRWYENGQKKIENTYVYGKPHGKHTEWYENGQKKKENTYVYGKPHGKHIGWYEDGQKKSDNAEQPSKAN